MRVHINLFLTVGRSHFPLKWWVALLCLGLFLYRGGSALAWAAVVTGAIIAGVGVVLIAVRARMPDR